MNELLFLNDHPAAFIALIAVLGLLVGSFLNVVIHRLPRMMDHEWREQASAMAEEAGLPDCAKKLRGEKRTRYNLVVPASHCPKCGQPLKAWHNIPLLSYLILRGRCANCRSPVSLRYPAVEAASGILAAYIAWRHGVSLELVGALFFAWSLLALTVIDIDTQLLPDDITLPLLWAGLLFNTFSKSMPLHDAVLGAACGYLSLWAVYWLFKLATGKEGMGFGDFKLLAAIGAWVGWKMLPLVILLSSFIGAVIGILLIALRRHDRGAPIPFGPYLAGAGLVALLWGKQLNQVYLRLFL